jgi:hypothetical protein
MSWCWGNGTSAICWRINATYYNGVRTLDKDSPLHRLAQTVGLIASVTWLGGLHRHYVRMA